MSVHPWHDIPLPDDIATWFPAYIEIPQGSKVKYELDKPTGLLMVSRVLYSAVHYPANYGFVPRTYCDDGDPLDVLAARRRTGSADPPRGNRLLSAKQGRVAQAGLTRIGPADPPPPGWPHEAGACARPPPGLPREAGASAQEGRGPLLRPHRACPGGAGVSAQERACAARRPHRACHGGAQA